MSRSRRTSTAAASLTESTGQAHLEYAEGQDAYGEYMARLANAAAGMVPVGSVLYVGAPLGAVYDLTAEAILDQAIDTGHAERQGQLTADVRENLRTMFVDQGRMALVRAGDWEEGQDPVTWAANNYLSADENFVRDGELIPFEELFGDDSEGCHAGRRTALLNKFLTDGDGGANRLREMEIMIDSALSAGRDKAAEVVERRAARTVAG